MLTLNATAGAPYPRAVAVFLRLIRRRPLIGFAGVCGFIFGGSFAYIAGSPFAYISYYHVPSQFYGLLFGAETVGMMAISLISARLVMHLGSE